jgi:hypothetical protein
MNPSIDNVRKWQLKGKWNYFIPKAMIYVYGYEGFKLSQL